MADRWRGPHPEYGWDYFGAEPPKNDPLLDALLEPPLNMLASGLSLAGRMATQDYPGQAMETVTPDERRAVEDLAFGAAGGLVGHGVMPAAGALWRRVRPDPIAETMRARASAWLGSVEDAVSRRRFLEEQLDHLYEVQGPQHRIASFEDELGYLEERIAGGIDELRTGGGRAEDTFDVLGQPSGHVGSGLPNVGGELSLEEELIQAYQDFVIHGRGETGTFDDFIGAFEDAVMTRGGDPTRLSKKQKLDLGAELHGDRQALQVLRRGEPGGERAWEEAADFMERVDRGEVPLGVDTNWYRSQYPETQAGVNPYQAVEALERGEIIESTPLGDVVAVRTPVDWYDHPGIDYYMVRDGRVIGRAGGAMGDSPSHVNDLATAMDYRRQGVADQMMRSIGEHTGEPVGLWGPYTDDSLHFLRANPQYRANATGDTLEAAILEVEEKLRPTQLSKKQKFDLGEEVPLGAAKTPTQTPEFRNWFGKSKVVDEAGEPKVVYHGTRADEPFGVFRPSEPSAGFPGGIHFTERQKPGYGETAVIPVHLKMENPLVVDFRSGEWMVKNKHSGEMVPKELPTRGDAMSAGHDGIIIKWKETGGDQYIVFDPTQIKSATGNVGTYDPSDPRITHGIVGGAGVEAERRRRED